MTIIRKVVKSFGKVIETQIFVSIINIATDMVCQEFTMKHVIRIEEILATYVVVEADNLEEAYRKAGEAYDRGDITLDSENYVDTIWDDEPYDEGWCGNWDVLE